MSVAPISPLVSGSTTRRSSLELRKSGRSSLLFGVIALATCLRVAVAGTEGPISLPGGILFAALLLLGAASGGLLRRPSGRSRSKWIHTTGIGIVGAAGLIIGPLLVVGFHPSEQSHAENWPVWAGAVTLIAVAEELMIRGALFRAVADSTGNILALGVTTVVFALVHVPFYGWHVMPLDLAVGLWLGGLRLWSNNAAAPAITHALADLSAWWL